ncbi:hypothetical protein [Nisaea nitritireducens]|uniref:hypothetical protein n=1 Tax=Nisaea nitritireducens TaxID=568392 RepID=UPI001868FCEE|nr:hypothetical protein [Nisaea nitritireducens]
MLKTIDKPGEGNGPATLADVAAAKARFLLSEATLEANTASLEWPEIFQKYPDFEFYEAEFEGIHSHTTTNALYMRYFADAGEYSEAVHHYTYTTLSASALSGSSASNSASFQLHGSLNANYNFGFRVRMHPNNTLPVSPHNYGGKHPYTSEVRQFGQASYPFSFGNGGFHGAGDFPATVSGFKFFLGAGEFSSGSVIRIYGVNDAGTVLV